MLELLFLAAITIPQTGRVVLPGGVVPISSEIRIPDAAHDLVIVGNPRGTTLRTTAQFKGRAVIVCLRGKNIRLANITIDGARHALTKPVGLPPSNVTFAAFYHNNGILAGNVNGLSIARITMRRIWGFPLLVNACKQVQIEDLAISDSGSKNDRERNNTTGGILLEEGTTDFAVRRSKFSSVLGNALWTHSNYGSARNARGIIAQNEFREIGRDAIQVGHATDVRVEANQGSRIGYPFDAVDIENGATPVGIDTSGNVDHTTYTQNHFEEVNGKCIDLDGFHDGVVSFNTCLNKGAAADYPHGHFGIVVNNWNPDMKSEHITIADNTIDGSKFGGIFLIGSEHIVERNHLLNLNLAHCNDQAAKYGCVAIQGEPDVLQAGIYLGRIAAEWAQKRADASKGHTIRDNVITGFKMKEHCIMSAPGVSLSSSKVANNLCQDTAR
jgi:hypothetical protein